MDYSIEVDDSKVRDLALRSERAFEMGVDQVTDTVEGHSLDFVPRDTDNLANTIQAEHMGTGSSRKGLVKATAHTADGKPYGLFVHEGTGLYGPEKRPIHIEAKNKKALTIPVSGARLSGSGAVLLRKSANVKGMKPRPFFKQAIEKTMPEIADILRRVYQRVMKK